MHFSLPFSIAHVIHHTLWMELKATNSLTCYYSYCSAALKYTLNTNFEYIISEIINYTHSKYKWKIFFFVEERFFESKLKCQGFPLQLNRHETSLQFLASPAQMSSFFAHRPPSLMSKHKIQSGIRRQTQVEAHEQNFNFGELSRRICDIIVKLSKTILFSRVLLSFHSIQL